MSRVVDFYFDLSSPYSYLASTRIAAIGERHGATVNWKPVVVTAIFKASQNTIPASSVSKGKYMMDDSARWAAHYGVRFVWTKHFPLNAIRPSRAIVAAEANGAKLGAALFDALWAEDRNISDAAEIERVASSLGLDGKALLAATETQPVKDRLHAYTDEAIARGCFGVPSIFVGNELFFGNDRLEFVEAALTAD